MRAQHALGDAAMRLDLVVGRQDREPGGAQSGHLAQQGGGLGATGGVAGQLLAHAPQEEGAPFLRMRDARLVRRDLVQERDALAILEDDLELRTDLLPVRLQLRHEREMLVRYERQVGHAGLPAIEPGQQLQGAEAQHLDLCAPPGFPAGLALAPAYCCCPCHLTPLSGVGARIHTGPCQGCARWIMSWGKDGRSHDSCAVDDGAGRYRARGPEEQAPASAGYFLADVGSGRYDGSSFFRIVTLSNQDRGEAPPHRGDPGWPSP